MAPGRPPAPPRPVRLSYSKLIDGWLKGLPARLQAAAGMEDEDLPEVLHHYTTAGGLTGILQSAELFATHYAFLNDATEGKRFRAVAEREVEAKLAEFAEDEANGSMKPVAKQVAAALGRELTLDPYFDHYVSCLSESGDLLSQWRGYGSNGTGYSIGFQRSALEDRYDGRECLIAPCIYNEEQQQALVNDIFKYVYAHVRRAWIKGNRIQNEETLVEAGVSLHWMILITGAFIKDPNFREEREWRLVALRPSLRHLQNHGASLPEQMQFTREQLHTSLDEVRSRITPGGPVPYVAIPLWDSSEEDDECPIVQLTIGPSPMPDERKDAARLLLFQQDLDETVDVECSEIPYRQV